MENPASSNGAIAAALFYEQATQATQSKTTIPAIKAIQLHQQVATSSHQPGATAIPIPAPTPTSNSFLSWSEPSSMGFLVRNTIAQHWPLLATCFVIIIYLTYYFTRVSKKPKLIGQRGSKFVQFIDENLKKSVHSRFSPLMYFWGANAQTCLFGYLQGRKSLSDEQRDALVKRQFIYVSDVQYLTSNKDLSKYYELIRANQHSSNLEARRMRLQLRVAPTTTNQLKSIQDNRDVLHHHHLLSMQQGSHNELECDRCHHYHDKNIRLALEDNNNHDGDHNKQNKISLQMPIEASILDGGGDDKLETPLIRGSESGGDVGVCSCSSASSSSDSGVFGTHAGGNSGQASCISSGSSSGGSHSSSSSRASTSSLHQPPCNQQQHQQHHHQTASTTTTTTTTRITTTTTTTTSRRKSKLESSPESSLSLDEGDEQQDKDEVANRDDYLTWVDNKTPQPTEVITITEAQIKKDNNNNCQPETTTISRSRLRRRMRTDTRGRRRLHEKKVTLFDVYSANKQMDKERLEFGQCALDWFVSSHQNYHKNKLVALISAGMTSGSDKQYVTDTVRTLEQLGYECCVFIRRGVGGLKLSSAKFFSPAKWRDFEAAVQSVRQQRPGARLVAVGFSFGSIELCRYLAMSGRASHIDSALLVSCPFDPVCGGENMHNGSYLNRRIDAYLAKNLGKQLYEAMFATPTQSSSNSPTSSCSNLSSLGLKHHGHRSTEDDNYADFKYNGSRSPIERKDSSKAKEKEKSRKKILVIKKLKATTKTRKREVISENNSKFEQDFGGEHRIWTNENGSSIDLASLPKLKSLHEFEYGFNRIVQHYPTREAYAQDCELDLSTIAVPTLCLSSEDDFMAPKHLLPIAQVEANPNLCMLLTKRGGHMAFVDGLVWPTKPYFAQRIIGDYMGALRDRFMQQQQHLSTSKTQANTVGNPSDALNKPPAPHIAIDLHHHHHHHHYLTENIEQQIQA